MKLKYLFLCILLSCMLIACETTFVVIGDTPYDDKDQIMLRVAITAISPKNGREWVNYVGDDIVTAGKRVDARDKANIDWLKKAFGLAKNENAGAVIIAMQADINILRAEHFEERYKYGVPCTGATKLARPDKDECDAFVGLRAALLNEVAIIAAIRCIQTAGSRVSMSLINQIQALVPSTGPGKATR